MNSTKVAIPVMRSAALHRAALNVYGGTEVPVPAICPRGEGVARSGGPVVAADGTVAWRWGGAVKVDAGCAAVPLGAGSPD